MALYLVSCWASKYTYKFLQYFRILKLTESFFLSYKQQEKLIRICIYFAKLAATTKMI